MANKHLPTYTKILVLTISLEFVGVEFGETVGVLSWFITTVRAGEETLYNGIIH